MPLLNNYGGILQNYALQKVLQDFGHQVKTIDYVRNPSSPLWRCLLSWTKSLFLFFIPSKRRNFVKFRNVGRRKKFSNDFCCSYINTTPTTINYSKKLLRKNNVSVVVVGSDQVWRPKYNYNIKNMFLDFCKSEKEIKRIAYAASFGVDEWEYTQKQTCVCRSLIRKFNAISVREESGVSLCRDFLNADATFVLDPTLLLKKEDYCEVCKKIPIVAEKFLFAYVLDLNESIKNLCNSIAQEYGLTLKLFRAGAQAVLSIPEWLAMFRDASYVITDSFHGTIFSMIFGKEFRCIYNESRGTARFESILKLYNSGKLDDMRIFSINWLKKSLES